MISELGPATAELETTTLLCSYKAGRGLGVMTAIVTLIVFSARPVVAQAPINKMCPVMTEETVDPNYTATHAGQVIGFCCERCVAKFEANPKRYLEKIPELNEANRRPDDPPDPAHEHADAQTTGFQEQSGQETHDHADGATRDGDRREATVHDNHERTKNEPPTDDHDHKHGHAHGPGFFAKLIGWLGKFHPMTVHFPIAMLLGTALAEILLIATDRFFFAAAGRFCLWVGGIGAVAAAVLGWFFGGFNWVDDTWNLTTHRWLGTATAAMSVLVLVVGERAARRIDTKRTGYRAMLFIAAALIGITAFFGGSLIYGLNHYAWS